jgi:glycosyltransferase involved in cell wall biosynthesis
MKKYPELKLVLMGSMFKGTLKGIDEDRIEFHEWVKTPAYPYKAAILDLDFAIIPLEDNIFNRCKSNIKWVEMGALSIPSVTSYISPYREYATENNGIYIEDNDPKAWIEGISAMVEGAKLRETMGIEARKTVEDHFDINKKYILWEEAYKKLTLGGVHGKADVGNRREIQAVEG